MKYVAGHQPNLYPYGGFFAKFASVDVFVIVDTTQYVRKEYHNRNRILLHDGKVQWLSIPVKNAGRYKQRIDEVEIDNSLNWRRKHLGTISANYRKSLFFKDFYPELERLVSAEWNMLSEFNVAFIRLCLEFLDIKTPLLLASAEGICGTSTGLIETICRHIGSEAYLHGKHARDYVDFNRLSATGIRSYVQDFCPPEYLRDGLHFEPALSIIDMLFFCGPRRTMELLLSSQKITEIQ